MSEVRRSEERCWLCSKQGHCKNNCPQMICYYCGGHHMKKHCWKYQLNFLYNQKLAYTELHIQSYRITYIPPDSKSKEKAKKCKPKKKSPKEKRKRWLISMQAKKKEKQKKREAPWNKQRIEQEINKLNQEQTEQEIKKETKNEAEKDTFLIKETIKKKNPYEEDIRNFDRIIYLIKQNKPYPKRNQKSYLDHVRDIIKSEEDFLDPHKHGYHIDNADSCASWMFKAVKKYLEIKKQNGDINNLDVLSKKHLKLPMCIGGTILHGRENYNHEFTTCKLWDKMPYDLDF